MRPIGRTVSRNLLRVLALVALALGGGCGGHPAEPEPELVATTITISPEAATLKDAGETVQLTATVMDQNAKPMTDVAVAWSSRDTVIARVSASGLVTAREPGTATVRASVGTLAATATVAVELGQRARRGVAHILPCNGRVPLEKQNQLERRMRLSTAGTV